MIFGKHEVSEGWSERYLKERKQIGKLQSPEIVDKNL